MSEYDNTNRGAAWKTGGALGKVNIDGTDYEAALVKTDRDKGPAFFLFLYAFQGDKANVVPLWTPKKESAVVASGQYGSQSILLFRNKSDHPKSPSVDIQVKASERDSAATEAVAQSVGADDTPF